MRIARNTPDRLVIEDRPWFLWITLGMIGAGALLAVMTDHFSGFVERFLVTSVGAGTLVIAWRFAPFQRIVFDRTSGTLRHTLKRVTGTQTWEKPLADIERATDEGHWDSEGDRLERVTLITRDGPYPLESGFSGRSARPMVEAINAWLQGV